MYMKTTRAAVVAIAVAATFPSVINAQQVREPARADRADDRDMDWGWLGLLGLAGLFGLKGREHHDVRGDRDRVAVNTR